MYWKMQESFISSEPQIVDAQLERTMHSKIDRSKTTSYSLHPFNINSMTPYKAYVLGISSIELERIEVFRAANHYFSSIKEFQQVTKISDSLLLEVTPYLIIPPTKPSYYNPSIQHERKDINETTAIELQKIYGIGPVFSKRIVAYRNSLGGFKSMDQLHKVYGLDSIVVKRILKEYTIND